MAQLVQEPVDHRLSWWRRAVSKIRSAFVRPAVITRFRKAERAVEAVYLDKPEAEANHYQATGAASVIEALSETDNACVQVGSLLVIKATTADGKRAIMARTLSPEELEGLEHNQTALRDPENILAFLQGAKRDDRDIYLPLRF